MEARLTTTKNFSERRHIDELPWQVEIHGILPSTYTSTASNAYVVKNERFCEGSPRAFSVFYEISLNVRVVKCGEVHRNKMCQRVFVWTLGDLI